VNSRTLPRFWVAYHRLPEPVKKSARKAFFLWRDNPFHPSLHFKCVNQDEKIWSVRITRGHRALGIVDGDTVTWFWIGDHEQYDREF